MANDRFWTDGTVPWISSKDVRGTELEGPSRLLAQAAIDETPLRLLPAGSVVLVVRSGILRHTLPVAYVPFETTVNQDIKAATAKPFVDARFLSITLQGQSAELLRLYRKSGTTVESLTFNSLLRHEISVPPLDVQQRIVDLIGALDENIGALQTEMQAITDALAASRMRLGHNAEKSPLLEFAAPAGIQIGPFGSQLHASDYADEGVGVVMPQDLVDGSISTEKMKRVPTTTAERLARHRLAAGDIVFPRRGDLSKRALVTSEEEGWLCGTGCIRFRPSADVDPSFIFEALSNPDVSQWLIEHAVGTTMLNLNTSIIENLPLAAPTEDALEIAASCTALQGARLKMQAEFASLQDVRANLIPALLSGEIEIPESYDAEIECQEAA